MDIAIIGWVWLGILIGIPLGFIVSVFLTQSKINELESELTHQRFIRDSLKEEIFRLDNQVKPQPRKKRNTKKR
jgi:uncharacterized membrane-anchored protein YhcB (DUF1043 family)|tara:strand:+ start:102 stop:323 length:222 start_codon:yes stop_codon:yes gene_type:complete